MPVQINDTAEYVEDIDGDFSLADPLRTNASTWAMDAGSAVLTPADHNQAQPC